MPRSVIIGSGLVAFLIAEVLHGAAVRVSWQPNPETDIAGYRLQWSADGEPLRQVHTDGTEIVANDMT